MTGARDEIRQYVADAIRDYARRIGNHLMERTAGDVATVMVDQPFWSVATFVGALRDIEREDLRPVDAVATFAEMNQALMAEMMGSEDPWRWGDAN